MKSRNRMCPRCKRLLNKNWRKYCCSCYLHFDKKYARLARTSAYLFKAGVISEDTHTSNLERIIELRQKLL